MINIIVKIGIIILNMIYTLIKLFPTKERITYISRQSNAPSIDFQLIKEEVDRRNLNIESVFLCKTLDGGYQSSLIAKIKYAFHMFTQMYYIATSKIVILDTYCIVISLLKHKKDLKIIQMWHSMGTMKKFGYQILDMKEGTNKKMAYLMRMHKNYNYVFCAGEGYKNYLAEGFGCNTDIVKIYPLPRVDLLQNQQYKLSIQKEIFDLYPNLKEKPNIVYVPTFRKNEDRFNLAVNNLVNCLDEKYNLIIKLHPLSKTTVNKRNVYTCPEFSSFDMLFIADYIISDFSCIIYEAAVMNIPLYFYNFDMDEYEDNRGLNLDYESELPGVKSRNPLDIIDAIKNENYDYTKLFEFKNRYIKQTKNATKDIVDFIVNLIKNKV